jgi:guanine nucleotide-binding protein G(i) subunit alpha
MKIINQNGFTHDELLGYRGIIYKNLIDSAKVIILQMRKLEIDCDIPENRVRSPTLAYSLVLHIIGACCPRHRI